MRVAIVSDYFYPNLGGTPDSAELLAKGLGARGHQVDIYAPYYPKREFVRAGVPAKELNLGPTVRIRRLLSVPWGAPLYRMALPWPTHFFYYLLRRPDVVHVQTIWGLGLEAVLCAKLLRIPVVTTNHLAMELHAAYMPPRVLRLLAAYVRWMCNASAFASAPSRFALEELGGPITVPHATVTNPVDLSLFVPMGAQERAQARAALHVPGPLVVFAGRLVKEKSIDVLLRAMPLVLKKNPDTTLVLAGHGDIRPELEALVRQLGVEKSVRFIGTLGKPGLAKLLAAADVYVSMSTSETQGLVRLQAMACGTPAVVARSAATPAAVDGMTLVEPQSADGCAGALIKLLSDEGLRARLGTEGRAASAQYAVPAVAALWEAVYARVVR